MELTLKLTALEHIYTIYDSFTANLETACETGCSHCCTVNVTLTTLEGYKIVTDLNSTDKLDDIIKMTKAPVQTRFQPVVTTNRLAELCAAGAKVPEEEIAEVRHDCPLLTNQLCPIYDVRPFGCRCFVSRTNCGRTGYADLDDFTVAVNTVFLQVIENLDKEGRTGNLADVLRVMTSAENQQAYKHDKLTCEDCGLIENWPLNVLMIPPEFRTRMEPLLVKLRAIHL